MSLAEKLLAGYELAGLGVKSDSLLVYLSVKDWICGDGCLDSSVHFVELHFIPADA